LPLGGTPVRLTPDGEDSTNPAVSRDGTVVAFKRPVSVTNVWRRRMAEGDPANAGSPWLVSSRLSSSPQWAPDGSRVAFRSNRTGSDEIWMADREGRSPLRVTHFNGPLTGSPRWSPD